MIAKVVSKFSCILECVCQYKIALNLGAGHAQLLIPRDLCSEISSCALPAPRFRAILYRRTHSKIQLNSKFDLDFFVLKKINFLTNFDKKL